MSVLINVQRTNLFKEFTKEEQEHWFGIKRSKYISHIDTLYYSVFLKNDFKGKVPSNIIEFVEVLKEMKNKLEKEQQEFWFDEEETLIYSRKRNRMYDHCISMNGMFDIFIASSVPNDVTPRIHIQLRSYALWCWGDKNSVDISFNSLLKILSQFDIEVDRVQENRIDYCYHTNCLQSAQEVFDDSYLREHLKTNLKIYNKVGRFYDGTLTTEYFSLGQRKSNNVFFRSYNKTREVVEMGYKSFFLEIWLEQGLISNYDFYVYSDCFNRQRYDSIEFSMAKFYVEYGKDEKYKEILNNMLNNKNITVNQVRETVKGILPYPTIIVNIEFQTMRKFYATSDDLINGLPFLEHKYDKYLNRLFRIMDNRKIFLNYLTSITVKFVKNDDLITDDEKLIYCDFWYRLRKLKIDGIKDSAYARFYKHNLNIELLKKRLKGNLASLSLYLGNDDDDIQKDMSNLISILNDNDHYVDDDGCIKVIDKEYSKIKEKKKKALNSYLKEKQPLKDL